MKQLFVFGASSWFNSRWRFQIFCIFTPIPAEMIQFDEQIFQMGRFNHQLADEKVFSIL